MSMSVQKGRDFSAVQSDFGGIVIGVGFKALYGSVIFQDFDGPYAMSLNFKIIFTRAQKSAF